MASFSSLAEFHRIHFKSIVPAPPVLCRFDADLVEKILYNLLSNAFKFTPDDGEINLKAELIPEAGDPATYWQVTLQDSGPGIAADQLEKVFDRFYQGDQPFHSDQQGTGIGLALTKELVQLHGGTVWAESPQGQGARFIVRLPFLTPDLSATDGTFRPQLQERAFLLADRDDSLENVLAQGQIAEGSLPEDEALPLLLIVEDNGDLRHYIRTQLARQYRVLESENGRSGWEMALSALPDLIISDWMMPEMDGIKLCQLIKSDERTSHIPYILLTALATSEGKMTGLETGADEYLTKPFDAHELQLRIRNLIEIRHLLRERFSRQIRVQPADITVNSADEKFLQRVLRIVEENMGDSEFSVEQFGQEVGLSRMQLHRKLTTLTGQSARDFIRVMRLKRAAQLLEAHWATVSEIAYEVGFNNLSYFAKCFKEQFGVLPNEYLSRPVNKPE
jgi:DNA-binding response OmpR family regulator